ncbi:H-NS family nucleoid-associated regulatory protein [Paraburkholderia strydomiana]|jgi:DNA-binding protein H-NS|uniref:H-NS family nucleoid-associated regulatory protein n=1 Tax=Paraburkholderia strydomiana TaxID=1245417 RepID=UPI002855E788|nr:H-NS family nucleoid-associated regulatory protein [Paraburkholderia strydomiana]MDR7009914.1 DNA-binding protein H-NS [Paraburkholderia strydomiana]
MATLESLQAKIQRLQAQADALLAKKSSAVIEKIKSLMAEHGLTTADIDAHAGGKKRGPKPGAKAAAKAPSAVANYRDPKTGATWSGRGRTPRWIANAKDRSKFLVGDAAAVSAPAIKKSAKAGNYVRGPQPALYRDPKSGATWSGRGRAPAWIANAKDRTKFLIDGATVGDKKPVVKKAPAAKKAAAKKAPAKKASRQSVAVPAPVSTVESGAELTT